MKKIVAVAALCLAAVSPAKAEWTEDAELCATIDGDHERAYRHCMQAIESGRLTPAELSMTYSNLAYELNQLGRRDEAIDSSGRAIELNETNPRAWANRCVYRRQAGHHDEALTDCREALRLIELKLLEGRTTVGVGPKFDAHYGTAAIMMEQNRREEGLLHARAARDIGPNVGWAQSLYEWYGLK